MKSQKLKFHCAAKSLYFPFAKLIMLEWKVVSRALEMVYTCTKAQTTFQVTIKLMITVHVVLCTCDKATPHEGLFVMVGKKCLSVCMYNVTSVYFSLKFPWVHSKTNLFYSLFNALNMTIQAWRITCDWHCIPSWVSSSNNCVHLSGKTIQSETFETYLVLHCMC